VTRFRALTVLAAAAFLAAGCSSTPSVSQSKVEDEVSTQLEAQVGQAPDSVDCPGDLTGEVGEEMRCTLTAGTDKVGLTVSVTEVDGSDVSFDIDVDDEVQGGDEG
jgi:type IV pilus biogenesis protein CpaD/CtpE